MRDGEVAQAGRQIREERWAESNRELEGGREERGSERESKGGG